MIGAILKIDGIGVDRDCARGMYRRGGDAAPGGRLARFVDGFLPAPVIGTRLALVTYLALAMGFLRGLG